MKRFMLATLLVSLVSGVSFGQVSGSRFVGPICHPWFWRPAPVGPSLTAPPVQRYMDMTNHRATPFKGIPGGVISVGNHVTIENPYVVKGR